MIDIDIEMQTLRSAITNLLDLGVSQKDLREEVEKHMKHFKETRIGPGDLPHHADPQTQPDELEFDSISMEGEILDYLKDCSDLGDLLYYTKVDTLDAMADYLHSYYIGIPGHTTEDLGTKLLWKIREAFEKEIQNHVNNNL